MGRPSTRAAVRTYPNAGSKVSAGKVSAGDLDRTIFPERPVARTFYRVRQGAEVLAVLFTWTDDNRGGWEAKLRGGLFIQTPRGGTPDGRYATQREAVEAELAKARRCLAEQLALVDAQAARVKAIEGLL